MDLANYIHASSIIIKETTLLFSQNAVVRGYKNKTLVSRNKQLCKGKHNPQKTA